MIRFFIFGVVLVATFILRAHDYERVPTPNHLDEQNYSLSGLNLVETGLPVSWSTLDYPVRAEVFRGQIDYQGGLPKASVVLYRPWLDQPPLFMALVGWSAHLNGVDRNGFVPSSYSRIPSVLIAGLVSVMIFLIARAVTGYWSGILAMIIYGTVPIMVFASRSAMAENLIALLLTMMIYLIIKFWQTPRSYLIYPLPLLIGLAGLAKPTGYLFLPLIIFLVGMGYYWRKQTRSVLYASLYLLLLTVPFFLAYLAYGYLMDREIFERLLQIQSQRPIGFGNLAWFFMTPSYDTAVTRDSWFMFCLLSAAWLMFQVKLDFKKKLTDFGQPLILLVFVYSLLVVMLSGGENDLLAWYRFPSYPFLAIIGAWGLQYLVKKADFFASFLAAGLLLGNRMLLTNVLRDNIAPMNFRLIMGGLLLPSIIQSFSVNDWWRKVSQVVIVGVIVSGIYLNVTYIYNAFDLTCENIPHPAKISACPLVPSTWLSTLHFPVIWRWLVLGVPDRY